MGKDTDVFSSGIAVVTGAGAGIGSGLARRLGALGMTVIVADINMDKAEQVAASIIAGGGKAEAVRVDVSVPAELDALADHVIKHHGPVKLLINNAGIETLGYVWEIPADRWEKTLDINIHGVVHGVRAFAPHMIAHGAEAYIANLASVGSFGIMPTQTSYMMSKHAIQSFSECLYLEMQVAGAPIHVSSIIPGMLKTEIFNAEAGEGEPAAAAAHRRKMFEMMRDYGMDLDEGCRLFVEQIAEKKFWVHSQPDMSRDMIAARAAFIQSQEAPALSPEVEHLLQH
ncbi:SDR family NAD(P)-dependent oxidoreductase [Sphingopyxis yananensis]|uniref:SDR family NAD(P)-dependent oxidoreductase n=1 Tax=Sphingopyxis yananensis TaxID=2886687 RepID=UPI001D0FB405|nr:SDR family NAD(P)-dependent oxidoreductase [Sphingopyxis yananensis]MCC2603136.1 SDR family NAD(P)-dependent oxidoreductase [Sphingopyxis yananensis]